MIHNNPHIDYPYIIFSPISTPLQVETYLSSFVNTLDPSNYTAEGMAYKTSFRYFLVIPLAVLLLLAAPLAVLLLLAAPLAVLLAIAAPLAVLATAAPLALLLSFNHQKFVLVLMDSLYVVADLASTSGGEWAEVAVKLFAH